MTRNNTKSFKEKSDDSDAAHNLTAAEAVQWAEDQINELEGLIRNQKFSGSQKIFILISFNIAVGRALDAAMEITTKERKNEMD